MATLASSLSRACSRRRNLWRRMLQTVARPAPPQAASSPELSNEYLYALYDDLILDPPPAQPVVDLQSLSHSQKRPEALEFRNPEATSETVDTLLAEYAKQGNVRDLELFISRSSAPPTELQRDLHVKAHIVHASLSTHPSSLSTTKRFPTGALSVLHQYESTGHFAPIKSYTRVISALFNVQTCPSDSRLGRSAAQAQAWDLFSHMRYVAHPVPDAFLYALMIRACGLSSRPEPERALDLWAEMQQNGVEPTKHAYEAVIRVCGRAGEEWLGEGMRLAREMTDRYSTTGMGGRGLWCALLEGCKRIGDLKKARWILAEAVRSSGKGAMLDAELIMHVFHTYASYKPPFRRETTRFVDGGVSSDEEVSTDVIEEGISMSNTSPEQTRRSDVFVDVPAEDVENMPSFSRLPPQTPSDVIAETRALFDRILQDRSLPTDTVPPDGLLVGRFAHVELTPVLLNAYLSVFYKHATIEGAREAFDSLFSSDNPPDRQVLYPSEYICVSALERCTIARMEDRHIAARWAEDVWGKWEVMEAKSLEGKEGNVLSFARLIERAHVAMRRVLLLSGDIDGALTLLRSFVARYPPNAVWQPTDSQLTATDALSITASVGSPAKSAPIRLFAKPPILSTRTVLTNPTTSVARPLVRLTSSASPKDDHVPPIIGFSDVDLLHTRLAEHGRTRDLGYVKWVCMAYSNALKKRRRAVLESVPTSK